MSAKKKTIKGYKGFDKDLKCRNFQFELGKEFTHNGDISVCNRGFHFCENPLDVLNYYPLENNNRYTEVEAVGDVKQEDDKSVTDKIHIKAELTLPALIKASVDFLWDKCNEKPAKKGIRALTRDFVSKALDIKNGALKASGYGSKLAASGDGSQLAASGDGSKLAASGYGSKLSTTGKESVVAGIGVNNTAAAVKGSWIVLAEYGDWNGNYYPVLTVKTAQIDGKNLKENTLYRLKNGEFVEVK